MQPWFLSVSCRSCVSSLSGIQELKNEIPSYGSYRLLLRKSERHITCSGHAFSSQLQWGDNDSDKQLCFPTLAKICLFLGADVCVASPLIRYNTGASLSEDAKTLLFATKLFGFAGFLFCLGAYIVQRSRRASRLMTAVGCVATICGFLSILGLLFPENLMPWLIGALCMLPISTIPFAFKRFV